MKHFIKFLLLTITFTVASCHAHAPVSPLRSGYGFARYPKELEEAVQTLYTSKEAQDLLKQIGQRGPVSLILDRHAASGAYWDSQRRTLAVNPDMAPSLGSALCCILFELHNAQSDAALVRTTRLAIQGNIDKERYVEAIERIEFENALNTSTLLQSAIAAGIFPKEAEWKVFRNFEDHYTVQQLTGHSQAIAATFDRLRPENRSSYQGTLGGLSNLSPEEKGLYIKYLSLKNDFTGSNPALKNRAGLFLKNEVDRLELCLRCPGAPHCRNPEKELLLLEQAFRGTLCFRP